MDTKDAEIEQLKMLIYNTENKLVIENRELRAKLEAAEREIVRQTGCKPEEVAGIYNQPISKPVINTRMGEALREKFAAERDAERYRKLKALARYVEDEPLDDDCEFCESVSWRIGFKSSFSVSLDQAVDAM